MKYITARQVIHDAFISDITGIDIKALYEEGGIQFTAKGADGKIMDHVGKGIIQQALEVQKITDSVAWAWNMIAYAPVGTARSLERNILMNYLLKQHAERHQKCLVRDTQLGMLARMAMYDIAHEDVTGHRKRRKYEHMGKLFGLDGDGYQKHLHKHFVTFRGLCQALPERSLPPISNVVWCMVDKADGDVIAVEDLRAALKMPKEAA